jgi:hypothetical protein
MFESPADEHINALIETLCDEAAHCTFASEAAKRQKLLDQIAQLRASQNPIVQLINR